MYNARYKTSKMCRTYTYSNNWILKLEMATTWDMWQYTNICKRGSYNHSYEILWLVYFKNRRDHYQISMFT